MPSRARCGPDVDQGQRERRRLDGRDALTCWVGWWACQDLNLGPHPYQQNAGNRCAKRRSRRSHSTVGVEVTKENPGCRRAFAQVRHGSNIQLLPYSLVSHLMMCIEAEISQATCNAVVIG